MLKFVKFNVNPKHRNVGDCSTRALAVCLDISYDDALFLQYKEAAKLYYGITDRQVIEAVLSHFGYEKQKQLKKPSGKKYEARELDEAIPERIRRQPLIVNVAHHYIVIKDDTYIDSWNSGYKTSGNYYIKVRDEDSIGASIRRIDRQIVPEPEKRKRIRLL